MTRQFRVLTWSRGLLAPRRSGPLRGEDRLPTGSDFLSVMRGHVGLSLREVVKWLSEVHRCALLSEGTENCSCVLCYSYQRIRKHGVACFILCGLELSPSIYLFTEKSLDLFCMMFMFFREHVVVTHVLSYVDWNFRLEYIYSQRSH